MEPGRSSLLEDASDASELKDSLVPATELDDCSTLMRLEPSVVELSDSSIDKDSLPVGSWDSAELFISPLSVVELCWRDSV